MKNKYWIPVIVLTLTLVVTVYAANVTVQNGNTYVEGNLGIGNANPAYMPHIGAGAPGVGLAPGRLNGLLISDAGGPTTGVGFGVTNTTSGVSTLWQAHVNNALYLGTTSNSPMDFRTNDLDRMAISANGNVGIGTTNPQARLDLGGGNIAMGYQRVVASQSGTTLLSAYCPAGKKVIGGGCTGGGAAVLDSYPPLVSTDQRWLCRTGTPTTITTIAVCANIQ